MTVPQSIDRAWYITGITLVALLLGACGAQDEPVRPEGASAETGPRGTSTATATAEPDAAPTTGGPSTVPEMVQVPWPDAPRELTEVEREFMYAPGPFAGDAFDEDAVVEAVVAMNPATPEEWQRAIQSQVQGDYVEDARAAILFDPSLSEVADGPTEGTGPEAEVVGANHFALVLDASGSMGEAASTGTKMTEAKAALTDFVATLPEGSTVSLRVYGHEGDNTDAGRVASCASSERVYQGEAEGAGLAQALEQVEATGWTPLSAAIADAAADIPAGATDGIVYVVTDGLESCGGDPVAAASQLAAAGVQPVVNVIGFQVGDSDQAALRAIADAGGGEYTGVDSGADLSAYWEEEYSRMMEAWSEWQSVELRRIEEEGAARMREAEEVGSRLMSGPEEEGGRAMAVVNRLAQEGHLEYEVEQEVWRYFYERQTSMWSWAYELETDNWQAAYQAQKDDWKAVYDTGGEKWTEYYRKWADG